MQRTNETNSSFFEKLNQIDKPLANLTKMKMEKIQSSKIRNKKGEITTNTKETQGIIRYYFGTYIQINWKILKKQTNF
jgi:hypothetical protein